mmetsp:Transcript_53437/g.148046  ORF Transcript_53437/g.148046 Transcript_53437/m.148046 type:complete len:224 (+) Transcript_53437:1530-2201(+)
MLPPTAPVSALALLPALATPPVALGASALLRFFALPPSASCRSSRRFSALARSAFARSSAAFSAWVSLRSCSRSLRMRSRTSRSNFSWCSSCSFFFRSSRRFVCSSPYSCSHSCFAFSMSCHADVVVTVVRVTVDAKVVVEFGAGVVVVSTDRVDATTVVEVRVLVAVVAVVVVVGGGVLVDVVVVLAHRNVMLLITMTPEGPSTMSNVSPSLNGIFTVFENV